MVSRIQKNRKELAGERASVPKAIYIQVVPCPQVGYKADLCPKQGDPGVSNTVVHKTGVWTE